MEKLELKHLAPYLPYGLRVGKKFQESFFEEEMDISIMASLFNDHRKKPILRPMSDLMNKCDLKEVEEEDDAWVTHLMGRNPAFFDYRTYKPRYRPYYEVELLIENQFDVFGLIPKGLAYNINDLKNERA